MPAPGSHRKCPLCGSHSSGRPAAPSAQCRAPDSGPRRQAPVAKRAARPAPPRPLSQASARAVRPLWAADTRLERRLLHGPVRSAPVEAGAEPAGLSHVPSSLSASASSVLPTTRPLRFRWRARPGAWPAPTHLERSAAGQRPRGNTSRRLPRTTWDANTVPPPETADSNGIRLPAVWAPRTFTEKDPALAVCSALSFP